MERIKKLFYLYRFWLKITKYFKEYFSSGFYFIHGDYLTKKPCFRPFIIVLNFQKKKKSSNTLKVLSWYRPWSNKTVISKRPYVLSIYYGKDTKIIFDNINKYRNSLCYQYAKYIGFDYKKKCSVVNYQTSEGYSKSLDKVIRAAEYILRMNILCNKTFYHKFLSEKTVTMQSAHLSDCVCYVQHGDLALPNVLFNGEEITVIDIDTINIYPALFDFIRLIIDFPDAFQKFIDNAFDNLIIEIFKGTPDENLSITRLKDKYLSIFIKISCWDMKRYKLTIPTCYIYSLNNLNCSSCKKNDYEE